MPRGPRLDAPGVLHHVIARGIERRQIFRGRPDSEDWVTRLSGLAAAGHWTVYAWALLPTHVHRLVRTGSRPLARSMRSLLTGYAGAFNRRHRRAGHRFQNRYRSIVVEKAPYCLELVRDLHLNPLRAGIGRDLRRLARYPYAGHGARLGTRPRPWQATGDVLGRFAARPGAARRRYGAFGAAGVPWRRRPAFQGGGRVHRVGGWQAVAVLRRGREAYTADARILGTGPFVEAVLRQGDRETRARDRQPRRAVTLDRLAQRIGASLEIAPAMILGRTRARATARARQILACVWVAHLGRPASELPRGLGQTRGNISLAAKRGAATARPWRQAIPAWCGQ